MGNIAIINAISLTHHALEPLGGGASAIARVFNWAQALPEVEDLFFLARQGGPELPVEASRIIRRPRWGEGELLDTLRKAGEGKSCIFYAYGDAPLLDGALSKKMYENHRRYYGQYSFADGYPYGLTPEILNTEILPALQNLTVEDGPRVDRSGIFTILSRDINSFDVETEIAPRDLRLLRLSLTADCGRNLLLLKRLFHRWTTPPDADELCGFLESEGELLRTLPAFGEIQITNRLAQRVSYLPEYPGAVYAEGEERYMDGEDFTVILDKLHRLSGGDMTVNLGFRGEPSFHPDIVKFCEKTLAYPGFQLLLETSGLGWSDETAAALARLDRDRIDWIVTQDSIDPQTYASLRGEGFEEVFGFIEKLEPLFPRHVWPQAVRVQGGEEALEAFYRHWKERGDRSIIQKYDWFCGKLPDRRVTDLSPLTRFPCWHLMRDIPVLLDGRVLICREDLAQEEAAGSLLAEDPLELWKKGEGLYREHLKQNYPGICGSCDEYYTFNF